MNKIITQPITQDYFFRLIFEPCLFLGVTALGSSYFRAMLIFKPSLIIEKIRYINVFDCIYVQNNNWKIFDQCVLRCNQQNYKNHTADTALAVSWIPFWAIWHVTSCRQAHEREFFPVFQTFWSSSTLLHSSYYGMNYFLLWTLRETFIFRSV